MTDYFALAVQNVRDEFQPVESAIQADADEMDQALVTPLVLDGPKECCADWAAVIECYHGIDVWECPFCGEMWAAPCR